MTWFTHIKKPTHLFNFNLRVSTEKVTIYLFQNVNIRKDINKMVMIFLSGGWKETKNKEIKTNSLKVKRETVRRT